MVDAVDLDVVNELSNMLDRVHLECRLDTVNFPHHDKAVGSVCGTHVLSLT